MDPLNQNSWRFVRIRISEKKKNGSEKCLFIWREIGWGAAAAATVKHISKARTPLKAIVRIDEYLNEFNHINVCEYSNRALLFFARNIFSFTRAFFLLFAISVVILFMIVGSFNFFFLFSHSDESRSLCVSVSQPGVGSPHKMWRIIWHRKDPSQHFLNTIYSDLVALLVRQPNRKFSGLSLIISISGKWFALPFEWHLGSKWERWQSHRTEFCPR